LIFVKPEASAIRRDAFSPAIRYAHKLTKKQTRLQASRQNSMLVYVVVVFAGCLKRARLDAPRLDLLQSGPSAKSAVSALLHFYGSKRLKNQLGLK